MATVSASSAQNAKAPVERAFQNRAKKLPQASATAIVMRVAQLLWPTKTYWPLSEKTGASDRMCRYWLELKYNISADDLAALLRSEDGLQFLEAVMGDAKPVWWRNFKRAVTRAELRRRQAQLAKEIQDIEQAELDL